MSRSAPPPDPTARATSSSSTHLLPPAHIPPSSLHPSVPRRHLAGVSVAGITTARRGAPNADAPPNASAAAETPPPTPARRPPDLDRSGMRVGRDPIASTIY